MVVLDKNSDIDAVSLFFRRLNIYLGCFDDNEMASLLHYNEMNIVSVTIMLMRAGKLILM